MKYGISAFEIAHCMYLVHQSQQLFAPASFLDVPVTSHAGASLTK